jgi:CheY-like chemotaxis protein
MIKPQKSFSYSALVVEDSHHYQLLLSKLLTTAGFDKLTVAENGKIGLEKAQKSQPHLVLLDGIMPEMDGLTALQEMRTFLPQTVIIIISSLSDKEKITEFKNSGADLYLLKPFDNDKFFQLIDKAITLINERLQKE